MITNITLQEVKLHCRIDESNTLEDSLLQIYIDAALEACQKHIGKSFDKQEFTPAIKAGCLMYIAHLYENREMVTTNAVNEVPLAISSLWSVYRDPAIY
ncbi:head-tail connector protein [Gilliamella sp. B2838]|uniref:head-tail connector protein n=1 Tax=Gilliamella sp. B2838 TaxID=2818020 RepID=UPI00226A7016|nr:head-tail connector protein [Gilliamella sp. B2838]MCX8727186.1 phage gp6-like head-tail connector protein [Gilliamella sp. B2838]